MWAIISIVIGIALIASTHKHGIIGAISEFF